MPVAISGMHRSGASMVARVLQLAGLYLGGEESLKSPTPEDVDGSLEHVEFVELNEQILNRLGGGWDSPPPTNGSLPDLQRGPLRQRATTLAKGFDGHEPWGWKDPRNSLTLPFWSDVLGDLKVVVCLRNPLEVAVSLENRDACSRALSLDLWKAYNERIIAGTTPEQRIVTHFDAYFASPRAEVRRLLRLVGLPHARGVVEQACADINPSLRHARFTLQHLTDGKLAAGVVDLYAQLQSEAGWEDAGGAGEDIGGSGPPAARSRSSRRTRPAIGSQTSEQDSRVRAAHARRSALRARLAALRDAEHQQPGVSPDLFPQSKPHAYREMIGRLFDLVGVTLPADARAGVVSRGDDELLRGHRWACHFPEHPSGVYAGSHPADSAAAILCLESLREREVDYLVFPNTAFWWLDYYDDFRTHLENSSPLVVQRDDTCRIYALSKIAATRARKRIRRGACLPPPSTALELDEVDLRLELASLLMHQGKAEEAAEALNEGLTLEPENSRLHTAMSRCAAHVGDLSQADRHMVEARRLAGDDVTANRELVEVAWAAGKVSLAEERLTHLLATAPAYPLSANSLVLLLCERVLRTPATPVVDRLVARVAELQSRELLSAESLFRASEILERLDRRDQAIQCLAAVLNQTPLEDDTVRNLATRLLRPTHVHVPHDDPNDLAAVLTVAGHTFTALHDELRAQACWQLARELVPEMAAPAFNLAWQAIASARPLEALEHLADFERVDADEAAMICWPRIDDRPWPHAPLRLVDGFESLKPADKPWPRITVITPSLNQAQYVEEAILSVLNQGYPDLEYIVVDGGSTDGSQQILRRYEPQLTRLIVEPDGGQSDAINKGLRLATGELVTWLNSDDMLAPAALHAMAAVHLSSGADLVAGFGLEHTERHFGIINLPAVTQETFNVSCLTALFDYWLKKHYFYQPEVLFTRRLLEEVGGTLRGDVHYTMDYDFWLRCAAAGGTVSVAHFPVAFFRKHSEQKTTDIDATVIELATVRNSYAVPEPTFDRALDVRDRLRRALSRPTPRVAIVSARASKIFAAGTGRELEETFRAEGLEVSFHDELDLGLARQSDLVILLIHLLEHEALREIRDSGCSVPVVGWTWDNHHDVHGNYRVAADVDVLIPGHAFAAEYLRSPRYLMAESIPLCTTQWTTAEATRLFADIPHARRRDSLYGGFVRYAIADRRNTLVEQLQNHGMNGIGFIEEDALEAFFGLSAKERFAQWAGHKASLCLPLSGDLSQRFFDALLTGQIPIVPLDMHDLDAVVPNGLQKHLPIVRFNEYAPAAVQEAHATALQLFDRDGQSGVLRRHRYALKHHMFVPRIASILSTVRHIAASR